MREKTYGTPLVAASMRQGYHYVAEAKDERTDRQTDTCTSLLHKSTMQGHKICTKYCETHTSRVMYYFSQLVKYNKHVAQQRSLSAKCR